MNTNEILAVVTPEVQEFKCCDNQMMICDESFSYNCSIDDDGKVYVHSNDSESDGFENFRCNNCGDFLGVPRIVESA